jgi:predicted MPP superfamily phosphohydrolase
MEILKNTLSVGAEKPFVFLHVSDLHVSEPNERETERRQAFTCERKKHFSFSPDAREFVKEYAKKTGYPLIHTGDLMDFISPKNLQIANELIEDTKMLFVTGNHEYWHCPNDRFHYDDAMETDEQKDESLAEVSNALGIDVRFFCREIGGVNLVGIDDADYCINEEIFEKLKAVEAQGKPILLFMHVPLYSEHLGKDAKYSVNPPPEHFENCHPVDVYERTPDEFTKTVCDHIRSSPLIRCVLCGHTHHNVEILGKDSQDQLVTGLNTLREITVI